MKTRFTWDPEKALRNLKKHGVSFEIAKEVFADPYHIETANLFQRREQRFQVIGLTRSLVLLLVVFVDRSNAEVEVIHIISARKGESVEEAIYEEQIS
jgi:hypothetical protein